MTTCTSSTNDIKGRSGWTFQTRALLLSAHLPEKAWAVAGLLACLCAVAYMPALNNGFISDDYVMLDWVKIWRNDFSFLLKMAPDVFRLTNYLFLGALQAIFGYRPGFFYA